MKDCLFCKIIAGEIPSSKVYEDKDFYAFLDIRPIHPGHTLIIPKKHCNDLMDFPKANESNIMEVLKKVGKAVLSATGADGFNLGMNNGKASGQEVMHAHFHIIPRFKEDKLGTWPRKKYEEGQMEEMQKRISDKV